MTCMTHYLKECIKNQKGEDHLTYVRTGGGYRSEW